MLYKAKTLAGYKLRSFDGEIGKVKEFYFDDYFWTIRYLVVDTGNWLMDRKVLISPYSLAKVNEVDKEEKCITVDLTKKQIEGSPSPDTDRPVSRQFEELYNVYYGCPAYWYGPSVWGSYPYIKPGQKNSQEANLGGKAWDHRLRSTAAVSGYNIEASDGEIGHVDDFIVDDKTWTIRYLVIDTVNWWPGKKVLISTKWIESVSWDHSKVFVGLSRDSIKQSPEYTEESLLSRDYEIGLHGHYGRQGYWVD